VHLKSPLASASVATKRVKTWCQSKLPQNYSKKSV